MSKEKKYLYLDFGLKPDGKRNRKKITYYTQAELTRKIKEAQKKQNENIINGNTTVEVWCNKWLETYKKGKIIEYSYKHYQSVINNYIIAKIGNIPISNIKSVQLQSILNECENMSKSHINFLYITIKQIFERATLNDLILKNPAVSLEIPYGTSNSRRALTTEERNIFIECAKKHKHGIMFMMMYYCGLRPQEVRALTWKDVDFKNKLIKVHSAIEKGKKAIKNTKTKAGDRMIPIPDEYMPYLKSLKKNDIYVFPAPESGGIMGENRFRNAWKSMLRNMDIAMGAKLYRNKIIVHAVDINITPYYLRHTYATSLAEKNIPMKTSQYLLGHSSISVTANIYTHVSDEMISDARNLINGNFMATFQNKKT